MLKRKASIRSCGLQYLVAFADAENQQLLHFNNENVSSASAQGTNNAYAVLGGRLQIKAILNWIPEVKGLGCCNPDCAWPSSEARSKSSYCVDAYIFLRAQRKQSKQGKNDPVLYL